MTDQKPLEEDQEWTTQDTESRPSGFAPVEDPIVHGIKKHSGIGIASTIIGVLAIVLCIVSFVMIAADLPDLNEFMTNETMTEEEAMELTSEYPGLIGGVLLIFAAGFLMLIGGILGLIGLFNQHRRKLFAIIGIVLNGLPIVAIILLMAIAMTTV